LDDSGLSSGSFVNLFDFVQKSNNLLGQTNVFLCLLLGCFVLVQGKDEKPIFEVLSSIRLIIFPLAIASKFCLKNFHYEIDVIEFDFFFFLIKDFGDKFVDFAGSPSQF
jgi:hypothetical protein